MANNLSILSANTHLDKNLFILNASIQYELTSAQINALHNGLPIMLKFRLEFRRKRPILDEQITKLNQRYTLRYLALTKDYRIKNINSGAESTFSKLNAALRSLENVSNYPLIDKNILKENQSYSIRLRAYTDVIELPITVKLVNYFSTKWSQTSDWYSWALPY